MPLPAISKPIPVRVLTNQRGLELSFLNSSLVVGLLLMAPQALSSVWCHSLSGKWSRERRESSSFKSVMRTPTKMKITTSTFSQFLKKSLTSLAGSMVKSLSLKLKAISLYLPNLIRGLNDLWHHNEYIVWHHNMLWRHKCHTQTYRNQIADKKKA